MQISYPENVPSESILRYLIGCNDFLILWHRTYCRPWLGMQATNLYAARLGKLENIIHKFPNVFKGVIVEEVFMIVMFLLIEILQLIE